MDNTGGYTDYAFSAEFYDYITPYRHRADVDFYVEEASNSGGEVLELGCGTGRILIPTARHGVRITGLDVAPLMLDQCRIKLESETDEVRSRTDLVAGDMRSFDLGRNFSLITTPFRSFQHLETIPDQMACLRTIRRHLSDDGRLILDLFNPSVHALADPNRSDEYGDEPEFTMPDGRRVRRTHRFRNRNLSDQINDVELIHYVTHVDGRTERLVHRFLMRYLFRYETEHLLARCGLRVETVYGGYDRTPFGANYPGELIVVARKDTGEPS